jgi:hypothetical protein
MTVGHRHGPSRPSRSGATTSCSSGRWVWGSSRGGIGATAGILDHLRRSDVGVASFKERGHDTAARRLGPWTWRESCRASKPKNALQIGGGLEDFTWILEPRNALGRASPCISPSRPSISSPGIGETQFSLPPEAWGGSATGDESPVTPSSGTQDRIASIVWTGSMDLLLRESSPVQARPDGHHGMHRPRRMGTLPGIAALGQVPSKRKGRKAWPSGRP